MGQVVKEKGTNKTSGRVGEISLGCALGTDLCFPSF